MDSYEETKESPAAAMPSDFPDSCEDNEDEFPPEPSLTDDLTALFEDGKNYLEAERNFQKSRAGFVANRLKYATAYGAAAFGVLHLALIAITVGLVIALAPIIGAWLATLVVGVVLILAGVLFLRALKGKIDDIRAAFGDGGQ